MFTGIIILILIASILMIGIVLIQKSKGGGLASNFASSNQIMGVRKTTNFVERQLGVGNRYLCVEHLVFILRSVNGNGLSRRSYSARTTGCSVPD